MKKTIPAFLFLLFFAVSCSSAPGSTNNGSGGTSSSSPSIYVSMTGNDSNAGTDKSAPVLTLQVAVMKAVSNSLSAIYVAEGIYSNEVGLLPFTNADGSTNAGVVISNSDLQVFGGCDTNTFSPQSGHYSILDRQGLPDHVIEIRGASNVTFSAFVLTRGYAATPDIVSLPVGGGFFLTNANNCLITNCFLTNNVGWHGAGLGLLNSRDNRIYAYLNNNSGCYYGGIALETGADRNYLSIVILNHNGGGGIFINGGSSNVITGSIISNIAQDGGGIRINAGEYNIVSNCFIALNKTTGGNYGGGVMFSSQRNIIMNSVISNNSAERYGGGAVLSGAYCCVSNTLFYGNYITNNTVNVSGGGLYIEAQNGIVFNCGFINNIATENSNAFSGYGGGLCASQNTGIVVQNCVFLSNYASTYGGAIANRIATASYCLTINSNLILSNKCNDYGSGIYSSTSGLLVQNNVISANFNCTAGVGIFMVSGWALIQSNIIASNNANNYGSAMWIEYSAITNIHNLIMGNLSAFGLRAVASAVITSNIIGGTSTGNTGVGIDESSYGDTTGHIFSFNIFMTNRLGNLYYDFNGNHIVTNSSSGWSNLNNTVYSGATTAQYNIVTNL